jgi:hypothetical protein
VPFRIERIYFIYDVTRARFSSRHVINKIYPFDPEWHLAGPFDEREVPAPVNNFRQFDQSTFI